MKSVPKKITCLMISFLVLGCAPRNTHTFNSSKESSKSSSLEESSSSVSVSSSIESSSSSSLEETSSFSSSSASTTSSSSSSKSIHEHKWSTTWSYDDDNHWRVCTDKTCQEVDGLAPHEYGEWEEINPSSLKSAERYTYSNPKVKRCATCQHYLLSGTNILPEIRFTSDIESEIDFATTAKKDDIDRPEVSGKITITNCDEKYAMNDVAATMKVRGNQTANWSKKAFRIKLNKKANLMGLNNVNKYKKWVLFADAKDTALIRSALGLSISKAICSDVDNVWVSDFTPVSVYLNDKYWGYYYLAEQKEVKDGRVKLPEPSDGYQGTDIGYCFEMDYYATNEPKKADGGDPTFKISYGSMFTNSSYSIESVLPNYGPTATYTLLSDITDGPEQPSDAEIAAGTKKGTPINDTNSNQVAFIKKKLQNLFTVLYEATKNRAKTIDENNEVVESADTVQKVIEDNFDLATWVDGFILNAFDCAPDIGYSSFYMSFDNSASGNKKLRFDVPWDFDSNFGNRSGFIPNADTASSGSSGYGGWGGGSSTTYDPYYMDRTSNMWLQLLGKLDFFMDLVKTRWNELREAQAFENLFQMMRTYFTNYDAEMHRNFYRWPTNDASFEVRDPFKNPSQYKQAQEETINWCAKRVNYLEKRWGTGNRPNVNTGA